MRQAQTTCTHKRWVLIKTAAMLALAPLRPIHMPRIAKSTAGSGASVDSQYGENFCLALVA